MAIADIINNLPTIEVEKKSNISELVSGLQPVDKPRESKISPLVDNLESVPVKKSGVSDIVNNLPSSEPITPTEALESGKPFEQTGFFPEIKPEGELVPAKPVTSDIAGITQKPGPVEPGTVFKSPLTFTLGRAIGFAEKKASGVIEGLSKVAAKGAEVAGAEKTQEFFEQKAERFGKPGGEGIFAPKVERTRQLLAQSAAERGGIHEVANAIADAGFEVVMNLMTLNIVGATGAVPELAKIASTSKWGRVAGLGRKFAKIGGFQAATSQGDAKDRLSNALFMIGFNLTPFLANATGVTGLTATSVDALLNTFISSPNYIKAAQSAKNPIEFAVQVAPDMALNIITALNTKGLPEKQAFNQRYKNRGQNLKTLTRPEYKVLTDNFDKTLREVIKEKPAEAVKPGVEPIKTAPDKPVATKLEQEGIKAPEITEKADKVLSGKSTKSMLEEVGIDTKGNETKPVVIPNEDGNEALKIEARKHLSPGMFIKSLGKLVFHGSPSADKILKEGFDIKFAGVRTKHKPGDVGIHFTDSRETASAYSEEYLRESYKLIVSKLGYLPESQKAPVGAGTIEAILDIKNPLITAQSKDIDVALINKAKELGHDGIIAKNGTFPNSEKEYVVFEPSQIKIKQQLVELYNEAISKPSEAIGKPAKLSEIVERVSSKELPVAERKTKLGEIEARVKDIEAKFKNVKDVKNQKTMIDEVDKLVDEHIELTKSVKEGEVKEFEKKSMSEWQENKQILLDEMSIKQNKTLRQKIKDIGGIAPFSGKVESEEFKAFPSSVKNKNSGFKLDTMADELGMTESDLREALRDMKRTDTFAAQGITSAEARQEKIEAKARKKQLKAVPQAKLKKAEVKPTVRKVTKQSTIKDIIELPEGKLLQIKLRAEARAAKKAFREGKKDAMVEFKAKVKGIREAQKQKIEIKKTVKNIKRISKIKTGIRGDYKEQIDKIASEYDLKSRSKKTISKRQSTAEFVERQIEEGTPVDIPAKTLENMNKKTLNDLTVNELKDIELNVKHLAHLGRNKEKFISSRLLGIEPNKKIETHVDDLVKEITKGKGVTVSDKPILGDEQLTFIDKAKGIHRELERPQRLIEQLGISGALKGGEESNVVRGAGLLKSKVVATLWTSMSKAFNKFENSSREKNKSIEEFTRVNIPKGFATTPRKLNERFDKITDSQRLEAYISMKRGAKLDHLVRGNQFNEKDLQDIKKSITPQEEKIADFVLKKYDESYPEINKIHKIIYGKSLPKDEFYSKIVLNFDNAPVDPQFKEDLMSTFHLVKQNLKKGFIKEAQGGSAPLRLDLIGNLLRHTNTVEKWKAFALLERDIGKVIEHRKFREAIIQEHGVGHYKDIRNWFLDSIGTPGRFNANMTDGFIKGLRKNVGASLLGGNLLSMLRQGMSLPTGMAFIKPSVVAKGILEFAKNPIKVTKEMNEKFPQFKYRFADQDIAAIEKRVGTLPGLPAKVGRVTMAGLGFMDKLTVRVLANSAYKELKRRGVSEPNAIDAANFAIERSQPMSRPIDLAKTFRTDSDLWKAVTMFSNQLNQTHNVMVDMVRWTQEGLTSPAGAGWMYISAIALPALLFGVSKRGRLPTEKEAMVDIILYPLATVPIGREISSIANRNITEGRAFYEPRLSLPPLLALEEILKTTNSKDLGKLMESSLVTMAYLTGFPVAQPRRTIKGIIDLSSGATSDWRRLVYSKGSLKEGKTGGVTFTKMQPMKMNKVKVIKVK